MKRVIHTFQTRLVLDQEESAIFDEIAKLLSKVERSLFADIQSGKRVSDLKSFYCNQFQITARQFNACHVNVKGLIESRKELQQLQIQSLKEKIKTLERTVKRLSRKEKYKQKVFYTKRRLITLRAKLQRVVSDKEQETVRVCFGTKKLFRSQFHLEKTGFTSLEEWKKEWERSRSKAFFCLGSKDETSGNQTCVASIQKDQKLTIRLRLPDGVDSAYGKFLIIPNVFFKYGHQHILSTLRDCHERNIQQRRKNPYYKELGQPIHYRFVRDAKGWRLFVSVALSEPEITTSERTGVIGVDINIDHLAVQEIDRFGNPLSKHSIPLHLYGKDKNQSLAEIGDACAKVIQRAKETGKDLVIEKLDFQKKKEALKEGAKYRRMLSSFAYSTIIQCLESRAYRCGVCVHQVDPAFTSLLGRVKFAKRYGLSIHHAAALCIARRYFTFSERVPRYLNNIPDGKGAYITLTVPERNRLKHGWATLRIINRKLKAVLAAQARTAKNRSSDSSKQSVRSSSLDGGIPSRESLPVLLG